MPTIAIPGLADPVQLNSAHAQIDGARVVLDRIDAQAGKLAFTGDYRYEPGVARPHRLRLRAESWDAADLEAELMPTLRRSTNLIARALGRPMVTDWLRQRNLDGTVQIDDLLLAGAHLENFRARVLWDVARVQLEGIQAQLDRAAAHRKAGCEPARVAAQLQADGEGQRDELAIRESGCRQRRWRPSAPGCNC